MISTASFSNSSVRSAIYLVLFLGLYACGFQLRGGVDLSEDIAPVYVNQGNLFELSREVKNLLATNKIKVVDDENQSKSTLSLLNERREQRVLSVDGSGRAREYRLTYSVDFTLKVEGADEARDSLSISRSLLYDPNAVLAVTNEADILYRDMQREVARMVLLKLQAYSRNKELLNGSSPPATDTAP